uniref:BlaI/MecI/CopY family transcriptional regulator n=1 Tax=Faecousia sp. TaxID=2952921 RepID=UPI0040255989
MNNPTVFYSEYQLCLLVWEHEPIRSTVLVRLCQIQLHWSKSTTYTVIRRLSERGILKNQDVIVHSLISKEKVQDTLLNVFLNKYFEGSVGSLSASLSRIQNSCR